MIHWLYKYIFRGFGIVFIIGMITSLLLAVLGQIRHSPQANHIPDRTVNSAPENSGR